jgi:hypothetical protein
MRLLLLAPFLCALALPARGQSALEPRPALPDTSAILTSGAALGVDSLRWGVPEAGPEVSRWRIATVGLASGAAGLAVLETQRRRWWDDRSPRFRIMNDWEYVRWADKAGHVYSTSFFARFYRASFRWAGVPEHQAPLWGGIAAWTQMFYYEVLDGFGPQWGFSPGDLAANTVGAGLTTAQAYVPALNAFTVKASYWPSGWEGKNFTDDYAGQTFWLTANPHLLAPEGAFKDALPEWLNVTVGYGARDLDEWEFLTTSVVYVGLDIEPSILPFEGKAWDTVSGWLRYIHFPAPALRLTPNPALVLFAY